MPRRRAVRTVVASLAALAVPGLSPRLTSATAAPTRRGGPAAPKCPDGSECLDGEVCCPMTSPLSGQFNCCKTTEHCCCGNACCDPQKQICVCTGRTGRRRQLRRQGLRPRRHRAPRISRSTASSRRSPAGRPSGARRRAPACTALATYLLGYQGARPRRAGRRSSRNTAAPVPNCGHAVQIGNGCHFAGSANYVRLRHDDAPLPQLLPRPVARGLVRRGAMNTMIVAHKTSVDFRSLEFEESENLDASIAWAKAGYRGWPNRARFPRRPRQLQAQLRQVLHRARVHGQLVPRRGDRTRDVTSQGRIVLAACVATIGVDGPPTGQHL